MARLIEADDLIKILEKKVETPLDELIVQVIKGAVDIVPTVCEKEDFKNVVKHGDLISRSELIETLKNPPVHCSLCGITIEDVLTMIDEQPTAYDVDEVVQELHGFSLNTIPYCNEMLREDLCDDSKDCDYCKLQHAIEIVRKGGVNGN